ncbi:MFS transporter, partial [Clostridium perfringens]
PENRRGAANASFMTAFDLGIGLGAIILGLVSERIGYTYLFTVTAASVVVSLVIFTIFVRRLLTSGVTDKE